MRIKTVRIHNFRSVVDQCLTLFDFNLLVGANNSGKSTCIDALRRFFASSDDTDEKDRPTGVRFGDDETWVQITFETENDFERDSLYEILPTAEASIRRYLKCGQGKSGFYAVDANGEVAPQKLVHLALFQTGIEHVCRQLRILRVHAGRNVIIGNGGLYPFRIHAFLSLKSARYALA